MFDAYLDIETSGLSFFADEITVIGIYLVGGNRRRLVQLVGKEITRGSLLKALEGVATIFTYNGSRFDLPFIRTFLGVDLAGRYRHCDLMFDCWRHNLYGGFKAVEVCLGIPRRLQGISGREAVVLWWRYRTGNDREALATLLKYNEEDVVNLEALRARLTLNSWEPMA